MSCYTAERLTDRVYWVGAIDWHVRDFHGYRTGRGSTYNAYLVLADRITLVDTVKKPFREEMMARISSVIEPGEISCIVSNHSEMDHTGCLPETIRQLQPDVVYASRKGLEALTAHFHFPDGTVTAVTEGETVPLGNMHMTFVETRMLHWPDSMVSYIPEERILFSQDGFGMHLASSERFDDELPESVLVEESARYFANILLPFSPLVKNTVDRLLSMNLEIDLLCPDHGPVRRSGISEAIGQWREWAGQRPSKNAVIVYDTMWNSTAALADAVCDGLSSRGISVRVMPLGSCHRSDVATAVLEAGALVVGSPTINGQIFPTVADCMTYLKGLKPRNLVGGVFGSYGWSGEGVGHLESILREMEIPLAGESIRVNYVPDCDSLEKARKLGESIGNRLTEICGGE
jgi:flavorubredoxin